MSKIEKLVTNAKKGNEHSFDKLYELTKKEVWFTCMSLLNNEDNAKDIMQDTYLTAFLKLDTLAENDKFSSWIKKIAVNKSKDFFKNKAEQHSDFEEIGEIMETDELMLPEEYIKKSEKREIILQLMGNALSAFQYQTVIMYYFDNMSVAEIAEVFECPEGTVMSRLNLARAKMKKAITDYETQNNDRLHSVASVPLFSSIFEAQSKSLKVPKINISLPANASQNGISVLSKGAEKAVKATGKGLISTIKVKAIATACALALVGGGVATAVVLANSDNGVQNVVTESPTVEKTVSDAIKDNELKVDNKGNIVDKEGNTLKADEEGKVEVKTDDGKTVKVSSDTVKTVNNSNGTSSNTNKGSSAVNNTTSNASNSTVYKSSTSSNTTKNNTNTGSNSESKKNTSATADPHAGKTYHEAVYKTVNHPAEYKTVNHPAEYKTVNHPAEYKTEKYVTKAAWTEEVPIYENQCRAICNNPSCKGPDGKGLDITDCVDEHQYQHALDTFDCPECNSSNTNCKKHICSYHAEWRDVQVGTKKVNHPAEYGERKVLVKDAWSEKKLVKEAWSEKVLVKKAWSEKVLVKEAGWY